jgi:hypothetical protein
MNRFMKIQLKFVTIQPVILDVNSCDMIFKLCDGIVVYTQNKF